MKKSLLIALIIAALGVGGWAVYARTKNNSSKKADNTQQQTTNEPTSPYAGWKVSSSSRAGFSIKYPADWAYSASIGNKDNVEHITIMSAHMQITINSYFGTDVAQGGQPNRTCPDCMQTLNSSSFTISRVGVVNLLTISYKLDSGQGQALVLEQPDTTYFIPSPTHQTVTSSFRVTSKLDSELAYQAETSNQFTNNPDYATARKILESLTY